MHRLLEQLSKVPKKAYWVISALLLLIDAVALGFSELLQKVEYGDVAGAYNTIVGIWPEITQFAIKHKWSFFILTAFSLFMALYKPRMVIIKHLSLSVDLAEISSDLKKKYSIKTITIDQVAQMEEDRDITRVIVGQDAKIKKTLENRRSAALCYYGIAHIPLIFRLGFSVGDQNNVTLLHKKRNNKSVFEEWNHEIGTLIIDHTEENESIYSDNLLVTISTSFEIKPEEICSLAPTQKHILHFKSNTFFFDNITSYTAAENVRQYIMQHIRNAYKKYNIRTIHMAIASSSAFVFFLSQAFSMQHDPTLIVYHYQRSIGYPWGIIINESPENAFYLTPKVPQPYKVLVSIYDSTEKMLALQQRDAALKLTYVSKLYRTKAKSLDDAIDTFRKTKECKVFVEGAGKAKCYFYYLDENDRPCLIEN